MRFIPLLRSLLLGLLLITPPAMYGKEKVPSPKAGEPPLPKKVFAHYMVCYFRDVEFYKREIALAQAYGIDGFALNAGSWLVGKTGEDRKPGPYVTAVEAIYQAAEELGTGFELFMSPDVNGGGTAPHNVMDMAQRLAGKPNTLKVGDRFVLSAWAGTVPYYTPTLRKLNENGFDPVFVPFVFPERFSIIWSEEVIRRFFRGQPHMGGIFTFLPDCTPAEQIANNIRARKVTLEEGKIFMAGVTPAMNSSNLRDYRGLQGYCAVWEGIVRNGADWVEIVTWNDFNEDTFLFPSRWSGGVPYGAQAYLSRDEATLDVTSYYARWFKTGRQPEVVQDRVYLIYRNRSKYQTRAWDARLDRWIDITAERGTWNPVDQIHDDVEDEVHVTTFLTRPATLEIRLAGKTQRFDQPAGIAHASIPQAPGTPEVRLLRDGKPVYEISGNKEIIGKETRVNSAHGYHLSNRTWIFGGVASGDWKELPNAQAELLGEAAREGDGNLLIPSGKDDGARWKAAFPKGAINFRIRYRNAKSEEARLTLRASQPLREGEKEKPQNATYLPIFMPPTKGEARTVSVIWTPGEAPETLELLCIHPHRSGQKVVSEWHDDRGDVVIESLAWSPVQPFAGGAEVPAPGLDLVAIPGGSFTMGTEKGEPDERPTRKVTLPPFAIGRHEVTNAEYEAFDPEHKTFRDGFSWRDNDPVIYVDWNDAIRYCNWLSRQNNLTPAYDEKTGERDAGADGFHLPTEAQWEYVATGRGENRPYPWGKEEPVPHRHGNFRLKAALQIDPVNPSLIGTGTTPVGSYPQGASRDGVLDLAGNVTEWCDDLYRPYGITPEEEAARPRIYRSIRGGSWGYYNYRQRNHDREFNNPGYPGYVYLGFRVALPEAGLKKLGKR